MGINGLWRPSRSRLVVVGHLPDIYPPPSCLGCGGPTSIAGGTFRACKQVRGDRYTPRARDFKFIAKPARNEILFDLKYVKLQLTLHGGASIFQQVVDVDGHPDAVLYPVAVAQGYTVSGPVLGPPLGPLRGAADGRAPGEGASIGPSRHVGQLEHSPFAAALC